MTAPSLPRAARGPEPAEYASRLDRVRRAMATRSLAGLIVTDPANLYYLTGYDAWSFYTPQCLVVPAHGEVILFARSMDAAGAGQTANLTDDLIEGYPEHLVHRPDRHPYEWIARRIAERGLLDGASGSAVGIEADAPYFSVRGYLSLVGGLPGVRFEDSRELVNWVRLVKSPYELAQLRIAGSIADRAMTAALSAVRPGRRQCDAVADVLAAQARGHPVHGGDYPAIVPLMPTGEGAGTPHLTWSDRPFRPGEATTIELAGAYRRYHAPLARTISLGPPPARLARTASVVVEGMAHVLQELRPGRTTTQVHASWEKVIRAHGLRKPSRIGYSIGIGYPPDWGERTVSLRGAAPGERPAELAAGMALHVILGMWMDGWGYELSEPVVVTDGEAERLAAMPQELTIV